LLNSETTGGKIRDGGLISNWLRTGLQPIEAAQRITIRCLSREPTAEERQQLETTIASGVEPESALEDFFWAVLNSNEFIFNH